MKDRKTATIIYKAFGFPVKLINIPMKKVIGEWVLDVNFQQLELAILKCILYKQAPLNGNELKFIRKFLKMPMREFGNIFGISHVAVVKWESEQTRAPAAADIYIRLYVLNHLHAKDKEFRAFYNTISPESLSKHKHAKQSLISINIGEDLKSA